MRGDAQESGDHVVLWVPLLVTLEPQEEGNVSRSAAGQDNSLGSRMDSGFSSKGKRVHPRPHLKMCFWPESPHACGKEDVAELEFLPALLSQRDNNGFGAYRGENSWITPKGEAGEEALRDDNHGWHLKQTDQRWYKDPQQMVAHLTSRVKGLDCRHCFYCLGWVTGLKAIWILSPSMGFCSQKEIDEKQRFRRVIPILPSSEQYKW